MSDYGTRKRAWRFAYMTFGVSMILALGYAFLCGPLFAWSIVKPGYDEQPHRRAAVYLSQRTEQSGRFDAMDRRMAQNFRNEKGQNFRN